MFEHILPKKKNTHTQKKQEPKMLFDNSKEKPLKSLRPLRPFRYEHKRKKRRFLMRIGWFGVLLCFCYFLLFLSSPEHTLFDNTIMAMLMVAARYCFPRWFLYFIRLFVRHFLFCTLISVLGALWMPFILSPTGFVSHTEDWNMSLENICKSI